MRILVGTPCGGGVATVQYMLSWCDTQNKVMQHKQEMAQQIIAGTPGFNNSDPNNIAAINQTLFSTTMDVGLYTLAGESLLQRGRNHIAQVALSQGWDKLFFIDSDAGWTFEQFKKIAMNPAPIVAGICPLKTYPISLNFLPFQEDEIHFERAQRSMESTNQMAKAHGSELVKVPFVGTAFLCIDVSVLRTLAETAGHYLYPNPYTGQPESHWDFFKVEPVNEMYLSEDWGFCHRAREAGFDVLIDTSVVINHTGNHTFRAG